MSWELEADVNLDDLPTESPDLVAAFVDAFGGGGIRSVSLEVAEGQWHADAAPVAQDSLDGVTDLAQILPTYCGELLTGNKRVEIDLNLDVEEFDQAIPRPGVTIFAPRNPGRTTRRRADAVLTFGNRLAYTGNTRLGNGMVLTERFVMEAMKSVCRDVRPTSLYLLCEEGVSFPIDYHFIYHHTLEGFADDLRETLRLARHGGKGYHDGRRYLDAALSDRKGNTMMFAKRSGEWLTAAKRFIQQRALILEQQGVPQTLSREFMDDVLGQCEDLDWFYTDAGLGVYALPPIVAYCEDPFFEIMERLVAEMEGSV